VAATRAIKRAGMVVGLNEAMTGEYKRFHADASRQYIYPLPFDRTGISHRQRMIFCDLMKGGGSK